MLDIENGGLRFEKRDDLFFVVLNGEVEQAVVESYGEATAVVEP